MACHVEQLLADGGLSKAEIIDDATTLRALGENGVAARDWSPEPDDDHGGHLYSIGHAALYGNGQRAVFGADGTLELLSFADGDQAAYVQVIDLAADGSVQTNSVDVLDQM